MHHILKKYDIIYSLVFVLILVYVYIYCSISIIKINKFTSLYILVTLWWESGWNPPKNKAPTDFVGVLIIPG